MSLKIEAKFKAAAAPFEYASGKFIKKFWCDIDTSSQYPSIAEFQFFNDKVKIDTFKAGDDIIVHFNISGKVWEKNGKRGFNQSLSVFLIEKGKTSGVNEVLPAIPMETSSNIDPFLY
jgi:hypothetical protein